MKKILIIGGGEISSLMAQTMKEKFGDDIVLFTPEEAKEKGLNSMDFENTPTFEIKPTFEMPNILYSNTYYVSKGKGARARNRSKFKNRK